MSSGKASMAKLAILAMNAEDSREVELVQFLKARLADYNIEVADPWDECNSFDSMVDFAIEESDNIIIVFDAELGMNIYFSRFASELYKYREHVRPILLITNWDTQGVDIDFANNAIAEIWTMICESLQSWDLPHRRLYFSYRSLNFSTVPLAEYNNAYDYLVSVLKKGW